MPKKMIDLLDGENQHRNKNKLFFQHPHRMLVAGESGSGKTVWIMKYLQNKDSPFDKVIWVAPEFSLQQKKMKNFKHNMGSKLITVPWDEGSIEEIDQLIDTFNRKNLQTALVLDDLVTEQGSEKGKWLNNLFTSGRHKNVSVIELTQRIFSGKFSRTNRLNTNQFVLFKFGDLSEFSQIAKKIEPRNSNKLVKAYELITDKPHGALIIDTQYHKIPIQNNRLLKYRDTELDTVVSI